MTGFVDLLGSRVATLKSLEMIRWYSGTFVDSALLRPFCKGRTLCFQINLPGRYSNRFGDRCYPRHTSSSLVTRAGPSIFEIASNYEGKCGHCNGNDYIDSGRARLRARRKGRFVHRPISGASANAPVTGLIPFSVLQEKLWWRVRTNKQPVQTQRSER